MWGQSGPVIICRHLLMVELYNKKSTMSYVFQEYYSLKVLPTRGAIKIKKQKIFGQCPK